MRVGALLVGGDNVDDAQVRKEYEDSSHNAQRRHPATCSGQEIIALNDDPCRTYISTSFVQRQNAAVRLGMR